MNKKWSKYQNWSKWCDLSKLNRRRKKVFVPLTDFRAQQISNKNIYELRAKEILNELCIRYEYQLVYGPYILDFYLPDYRVDLELDGYFHRFRKKQERRRTQWLREKDITTIRYWNNRLLDPERFKKDLLWTLEQCSPVYLENKQMDEAFFRTCA